MSAIEKDFDRLAQLDDGGWTQNNHYHKFLLRHVPRNCLRALEIGCGTGAFARQLAKLSQQVTALDLSAEMVRVARSRSAPVDNLEYQCADVMSCDLPNEHFDCVATIATLHHLPLRKALAKLKNSIKAEGILLVLDLFEPERSLRKVNACRHAALNALPMP